MRDLTDEEAAALEHCLPVYADYFLSDNEMYIVQTLLHPRMVSIVDLPHETDYLVNITSQGLLALRLHQSAKRIT